MAMGKPKQGELPVGYILKGRYEILGVIGRGGMSVVYLARDTSANINKTWAIKQAHKSGRDKNGEFYVQSLTSEADRLQKLNFPAFPRINDIIEMPNDIFIVMDYIEGEPLDRVIKERGTISYECACNWGVQIAKALLYLHGQTPPIIYRDLKPANIIYQDAAGSEYGLLKIIDFGTAREYKEGATQDTKLVATPGYASPEQVSRIHQTDERSDIYSLGMTLHHMLTGAAPNVEGYEYRPIRDYDPSLPAGLEMVIETCIAPDPRDRFDSCKEVIYWLEPDDSGRYHFEDFDADYRNEQKKKLVRFASFAAACLVFAGVAIGAKALDKAETNRNYQNLMASHQYEEAIKVAPTRLDAYEGLLDSDKKSDNFMSAEESTTIDGLVKSEYIHQNGNTDTPEYMKFCYDMAYAYFFFYQENGVPNLEASIQKAAPYLEQINSAIEKDEKLADQLPAEMSLWKNFYTITSNYTTSNAPDHRDLKKDELNAELSAIDDCIDSLGSANLSAYAKIMNCKNFAQLINNINYQFPNAGISQQRVLQTLNKIKNAESGIAINESDEEVKAEKNKALSDIDTFIENINNAYSNNLVKQ